VVRTKEFGQRAERLPDFSQGDAEARRQAHELAPQCKSNGAAASDPLCIMLECGLLRTRSEEITCP
jgi:hypothetical protein